MAREFELLKVGGTPHQIGLQVGQALRYKIPLTIEQIFDFDLKFYDWQTIGGHPEVPALSRSDILARTHDFLPLFERYAPGMVEELRGISEGARISFEEALLLQIRGEIVYATTGACTTFAVSGRVTRDGLTLAGQNWDQAVDLDSGIMHLLHVTPVDGPRQLMITFAGLTSFLGMNSAGVGCFANSLPWRWCKVGIPHYPVCWRVFRESDLSGVRRVLDETDTVQAENHLFADGSGAIADAELTPEGVAWLEPEDGFIAHTNHFISKEYGNRADLPVVIPDTVPRYERMRNLLGAHVGKLDVATMQELLSDHEGYPRSICRHEGLPLSSTIASMISIPERGILYVCRGNPCEDEYVEYKV
jgi:isopenicillin-N N-acyltransferase-like protein